MLPGQNTDVSLELGLRLMLIALGTNRHGNSKTALHTALFLPQKLSVDICFVQRIVRLSCNFLVSFLSVLGDNLLRHPPWQWVSSDSALRVETIPRGA